MRLRNDPLELRRLALAVERFFKRQGLASELAMKVNLALDELLTNVMRYGFPAEAEGNGEGARLIEVSLVLEGGQVVARLRDNGRPFNPLDLAPPDLDVPLAERPVGGLGIFLARQMMDGMRYRRDGDHNCLTLIKRLP